MNRILYEENPHVLDGSLNDMNNDLVHSKVNDINHPLPTAFIVDKDTGKTQDTHETRFTSSLHDNRTPDTVYSTNWLTGSNWLSIRTKRINKNIKLHHVTEATDASGYVTDKPKNYIKSVPKYVLEKMKDKKTKKTDESHTNRLSRFKMSLSWMPTLYKVKPTNIDDASQQNTQPLQNTVKTPIQSYKKIGLSFKKTRAQSLGDNGKRTSPDDSINHRRMQRPPRSKSNLSDYFSNQSSAKVIPPYGDNDDINELIHCRNIDTKLQQMVGISADSDTSNVCVSSWKAPSDFGLENSHPIIPNYYMTNKLREGRIFSINYKYIIIDDIRNFRPLNTYQLKYIETLNHEEKNNIIQEFNHVALAYNSVLVEENTKIDSGATV
jgi:hypothetical protein